MARIADLPTVGDVSDLNSEFDNNETDEKKRKRNDLCEKVTFRQTTGLAQKDDRIQNSNRERFRSQFMAMNAFERHKRLINDYVRYYSKEKSFDAVFKRDTTNDKTDIDIIRSEHRFLWDDEEDGPEETWEKRLAKKYYDKLFKEYCICDLSHWQEKKIAMRWRIDREIVSGKGQFICGEKRCDEKEHLRSWEVLFGYVEHGKKRDALVKLRLCPSCTKKLHFGHKVKEIVPKEKESEPEVTEIDESASVQKKSRLDTDDDTTTIPDDGKMWSQPLAEARETTREDEFEEYLQTLFF
ncbi:unnamed protein product [Rotaria magnacalcarata]|uniref:Protein FRA10AC1 n=1 Tax=Rotaria magnacalcarata TaxID=392030 RepID=A0A816TVB0_9BILA|nr:unnamed protein product [Rotaria magnacalcarata]CAF2046941.1 unnamed protein product [Rotaria magnacalcarata]CAF2065940.1 unnamed protein product [Rotaria magnacalcarata]CAF2105835.1 unnamed protein product [Rotaria magnacalcarata]